MNKRDEIRKVILDFGALFETYESLLEYRNRLGMVDDHLAIALCEFYSLFGAYKIGKCIRSICDFGPVSCYEENRESVGLREALPKYEAVNRAVQNLLLAINTEDRASISGALEQLGMLSLCLMPEQIFSKMEQVALHVMGRAQQLFWVDLSLFATGVGDYQRARMYIQQARIFELSSRELYNVYVIEGLIALQEGWADEAIRCLDSSTKACQADVDSSIQCSLLPPNLDLAKRLLELGKRIEVLRYLTECHNVWQQCRSQIEEWIQLIESGEKPDFRTLQMPGDADQLSYRLNIQWLRGCSLEMKPRPAQPKSPMSPARVLAERERQQAEHESLISARIKAKLAYLEEDRGEEAGGSGLDEGSKSR